MALHCEIARRWRDCNLDEQDEGGIGAPEMALPRGTCTSPKRDGEGGLKITIVGAGIAGLVAALALRNNGHTVTLLERSSFAKHKEAGNATYIGPNASGLLLRLGWDPAHAGAIKSRGFLGIDGITGKVKTEQDFSFADEKWKAADGSVRPWLLCHRVDLHNELKRLVLDPQGEGRPAVLHLGVVVEYVDVHTGTVRLEDGRSFASDLVIGADGNNSFCRRYVQPEARLEPFGKSCYRFMLSKGTLLEVPETAVFAEKEGVTCDVAGPDGKIVIYPCRSNTMINCVAIVHSSEESSGSHEEGRDENWIKKGDKDKMEKSFEKFHEAARRLLGYAGEDLKAWKLNDLAALKSWGRQKLVLIGDAAHPFLPFLGQGAAQAIEDGVCIATLLQPGTDADEVENLMQLYEGIRKRRVDFIQEQTRYNGLDENKGRPPPSRLFALLDFCFKHDEHENTMARLREWRGGEVNWDAIATSV